MAEPILVIASGDLRLSANQQCWPAQHEVEDKVMSAVRGFGSVIERGHPYDEAARHGFIASQQQGMEIFRRISPTAPLIIVEAVWQYTHHVLPGLYTHQGPILTVANWSGEWPGLVGMLNLNGSLTKAGIPYSTLWSENFDDEFFLDGLKRWLRGEKLVHDASHVHSLGSLKLPRQAEETGAGLGKQLRREKAIMGIFDEGCMGMYNAILPDELVHNLGVFKERLSQSALYAEMLATPDAEALAVRAWLDAKGMTFVTGPNPETDLTDDQILLQCKMYIAAMRIADDFGCSTIGIQYQQGLKDLVPASDLSEALLNSVDRPPVTARGNGRVLYEGKALPHFNEVDECAGLDAIVTNRVWTKLGYEPETTLHDVRYGLPYGDDYVWIFQISGAVPPAHLVGGYAGAISERQPSMYFRLGGGTVKGVGKAGEIVWSRIFVDAGILRADIGRGKVVELPAEENKKRWAATTPQWPLVNTVLYGVTRDQFMARHKANHIQVAYAPSSEAANKALATKAAMFRELGIEVAICGTGTGLE
jgi:hypothetical protein